MKTQRPSPSALASASLGEWSALELFERALASSVAPGVELGIGDDCAILTRGRARRVWTIDACLENQHFRAAWLTPADIAHKALHAAVSDVAAMGARPLGALSHVTLGPTSSRATIAALARGQKRASELCACPIVGGNLTHGASFGIVTTVLGEMDEPNAQPLRRDGARPGDEIWLVGELGLASLGLRLLEASEPRGAAPAKSTAGTPPLAGRNRAERRCLQAFRRPRALVDEGLGLVGRARSCLDVSDGLAGDAAHVARASGVRLVVDGALLLATAAPEFQKLARALAIEPLSILIQGGEDYALLATGPTRRRPAFARVIGRVEKGAGVMLDDSSGQRPLGGAFEHRSKVHGAEPRSKVNPIERRSK